MIELFPTRVDHCGEHGEYIAQNPIRSIWTRCPACAKDAYAESERLRLEEEDRQAKDALRRRSGLVGRFLECTFDSYNASTPEQKRVLSVCRTFVADLKRGQWPGLWLIGPPGTGKSHLGAAVVNELIEARRIGGHMTTAHDMVRSLRATWRRDSPRREEDVLRELSTVPVLILDEIGITAASESEAVQMFEVLDKRYQLQRPVIVLSNLTVPEIRRALGDRLYDRLREGAQVLACDWSSYRGRH